MRISSHAAISTSIDIGSINVSSTFVVGGSAMSLERSAFNEIFQF
jgi:hypothetical protein